MARSVEGTESSFSIDGQLGVFSCGNEFEGDVYVDFVMDGVIHLGIETKANGDDEFRFSVAAELSPEEAMAVAERLSMTAAEMMDFEEVDDGE